MIIRCQLSVIICQGIFLFLSEGVVAVNFIVMNLMQEILDKEEQTMNLK
ncbi:MAG: hypothetical protein PUB10_04975 [Clostridiales bacterium]|nr:hypothetical protein [Clostridiales bacterium]